MSCVLRISGRQLDVRRLLRGCTLRPDSVWHKGEAGVLGRRHLVSGVAFLVSDADLDQFERQVQEATEFLIGNADDIVRVVGFDGVELASLEFGIAIGADKAAAFDRLPASFIRAAARVGVSVCLSHYLCSDDEG